jgi:hypothetical protein
VRRRPWLVRRARQVRGAVVWASSAGCRRVFRLARVLPDAGVSRLCVQGAARKAAAQMG